MTRLIHNLILDIYVIHAKQPAKNMQQFSFISVKALASSNK